MAKEGQKKLTVPKEVADDVRSSDEASREGETRTEGAKIPKSETVGDVDAVTNENPGDMSVEALKENEASAMSSKKAGEVDEGYDPYLDPLVPSTVQAEAIATELRAFGKSETLKGLVEGKKDEEKK